MALAVCLSALEGGEQPFFNVCLSSPLLNTLLPVASSGQKRKLFSSENARFIGKKYQTKAIST